MHDPVHAEKRAKSHCNCIDLKELSSPMADGGENFLQPLLGCTLLLVVVGNGFVDLPLASLLRVSAVKFFKTGLFSVICHCDEYCTSGSHICFDFAKSAEVHQAYT